TMSRQFRRQPPEVDLELWDRGRGSPLARCPTVSRGDFGHQASRAHADDGRHREERLQPELATVAGDDPSIRLREPYRFCGTPPRRKCGRANFSRSRRSLPRLTSRSLPFNLRTLPATITVSTLVRSISDTTAPGTLLSGATLIAVASRMMMSASLPGVSEPVLPSSLRAFAPLMVA